MEALGGYELLWAEENFAVVHNAPIMVKCYILKIVCGARFPPSTVELDGMLQPLFARGPLSFSPKQ